MRPAGGDSPVAFPPEVVYEPSVRSVLRVPNEDGDTAGPPLSFDGVFLAGEDIYRSRVMCPSLLGVRRPWPGLAVDFLFPEQDAKDVPQGVSGG
jgi:hypothetical protein